MPRPPIAGSTRSGRNKAIAPSEGLIAGTSRKVAIMKEGSRVSEAQGLQHHSSGEFLGGMVA